MVKKVKVKVPSNGGKHHGSNAKSKNSNREGETKRHMARTGQHGMTKFLQHVKKAYFYLLKY